MDPEFARKLPESKWLRAYSLADSEGRLIDRQTGHLVDAKGRRIDEEGYLLDADGRRVSEEGIPLGEDGSYLPPADAAPFLDEDGTPVETPKELQAEAKAEAKVAPEATLEVKAETKAEPKSEPAPALV